MKQTKLYSLLVDKLRSTMYAALGILCVGLGIIGVWLPGMPTTVFILIALWAFSNSSQRLHDWLVKIPILRPAIIETQRFQKEGTVSIKSKLISQGCAWTSFMFVTVALQSVMVSLIVGGLALSCSVFMFMVPTAKPVLNDEI